MNIQNTEIDGLSMVPRTASILGGHKMDPKHGKWCEMFLGIKLNLFLNCG
jgi:hypothetical protein